MPVTIEKEIRFVLADTFAVAMNDGAMKSGGLQNVCRTFFTAVAHYETNTFGRFPAGFSELLGYSDVSTSQFQFPTCQKLVQLRMFKNGRVDLKFKTASIAKEFAETYLDYSC